MSPEQTKYVISLLVDLKAEMKQLRKDLANVESVKNRVREQKKENSRLVAILDKHGIDADKRPTRGRPRKNQPMHTFRDGLYTDDA